MGQQRGVLVDEVPEPRAPDSAVSPHDDVALHAGVARPSEARICCSELQVESLSWICCLLGHGHPGPHRGETGDGPSAFWTDAEEYRHPNGASAGEQRLAALDPRTGQAATKTKIDDMERAWRWLVKFSGGATQQDLVDLLNEVRAEARSDYPMADKASYALGWNAAVEACAKAAEQTQPTMIGTGGTGGAECRTHYQPNPYAATCAANIRKLAGDPRSETPVPHAAEKGKDA